VSVAFRNLNAQRGLAMLALVAMLVMGSLYWLMGGLAQPANRTAAKRAQNAKVLQDAKTALVGFVAMKAATPPNPLTIPNDNPGSLPCPEALGDVGDPVNEGRTAPSCTLPAVGRLPWRTLGIEKPLDAAAEPLWYIVSPGWAKPNPGGNTIINSNTAGQITVDGIEAVAVIIAPGERLNIPASANCVARNQARSVPSPAIDFRDYLDCQNATPADLTFTSSDPVGPFNDQVLAVTPADVLPVIEAAVAKRFERDIAPLIRSTYTDHYSPSNPNPAWAPVPAGPTRPVMPFAATFGSPAAATFGGVAGTYRGLLPFVRSQTACTCTPPCECTPTACTGGADCITDFVRWTGTPTMTGPNVYSPNCSVSGGGLQINCHFNVRRPLLGSPPASTSFTLTMQAMQVGQSLKQFQPEALMPGVLPAGRTLTGTLNNDGSATITLSANADTSDAGGGGLLGGLVNSLLCSITGLLGLTVGCSEDDITIPFNALVDHPILDPTNLQYGWFVRNQWHQVSYYAIAQEIAPDGSGSCVAPAAGTNSDCLTVKYSRQDLGDDRNRGLIVIAGRRLNGQAARPNGNLADWLEGENADVSSAQAARTYATRDPSLAVNRTFNDRAAVIDRNP
jgi:hypothetical protein